MDKFNAISKQPLILSFTPPPHKPNTLHPTIITQASASAPQKAACPQQVSPTPPTGSAATIPTLSSRST